MRASMEDLRDHLAGHALAGLLTGARVLGQSMPPDDAASLAVEYATALAKALIKARRKADAAEPKVNQP